MYKSLQGKFEGENYDRYIYRERERERKTEFLGLTDLSSMKYFKT